MKKIPTLFKREFADHQIVKVLPEVTHGMEWVLKGEGVATIKIDGACCAIINGEFYKRYDVKKGKKSPKGAISCCDPDLITGHWPHWVKVKFDNPADKWFVDAYNNTIKITKSLVDGTYEAVGPHFQGNPYNYQKDILIKHGTFEINTPRDFDGIRQYLKKHHIEGIVFWKNGEPQCKIKSSDFGFEWKIKIK